MKILTNSKNIIDGLAKLNITDSETLLSYLPYRYEDQSYSDELDILDKEKITILIKIVSNPKLINTGRVPLITFFAISSHHEFYKINIFNQPYLMKSLLLNEEYSITGTYSLKNKTLTVSSLKKGIIESKDALKPVYHLPSEINQKVYRNLVKRTLESADNFIVDSMIPHFKEKYRLLDYLKALNMVHFPSSFDDIKIGLRTLKYHECLEYSLKNQIIRGESKRLPSIPKQKIELKKVNDFILSLDFKLTKDQLVAVREIILDMNRDSLMYRLLQGDVGSGKTIVALTCLYSNFLRGYQGAFMVPTDTLARQQYEEAQKVFAKFNIKVALLVGSLSTKERNDLKQKIENGEINVIVGTHALFSKDISYMCLGLAIIDEQHRFGVNQRNLLVSKGENCDLLLMSATPIPRTLALTIYGDMDISTLNVFPNQKRDVETKIVKEDSLEIKYLIDEMIEESRQVFIVSSKIEGEDETKSVEKLYEKYSLLYPNQVLLLHGKMDNDKKEAVLKQFLNKEKLILVATSVIELGINVVSAGLMIIYNPSNFGLASLHQLRGRISRDGNKGYCLLVTDEDDERLLVLVESNDGFKIAEQDMKNRGPGDMIGVRQAGFPLFNSLNIVDDFRMFECARDDAKEIMNNLSDKDNQRYYQMILNKINHQD